MNKQYSKWRPRCHLYLSITKKYWFKPLVKTNIFFVAIQILPAFFFWESCLSLHCPATNRYFSGIWTPAVLFFSLPRTNQGKCPSLPDANNVLIKHQVSNAEIDDLNCCLLMTMMVQIRFMVKDNNSDSSLVGRDSMKEFLPGVSQITPNTFVS